MTINRIRLLPLCLLCLLLAVPARAEQSSANLNDAKDQATQAAQAFLSADPYWADWEIADLLLPTGLDGQPLNDCLALLRLGNRYDIARFVWRDGWQFDYNNPFAIPDTELPVRLLNEAEQLAAFSIQIGQEGAETWQLYFQRTEAADWALFFVDSRQPRVIVNLEEVQPTGENALYYGYGPDGSGYQWVQTPIERSLRAFSFADFPWSPEAAIALGQPEPLAELVGTALAVAPGLRYAVIKARVRNAAGQATA